MKGWLELKYVFKVIRSDQFNLFSFFAQYDPFKLNLN